MRKVFARVGERLQFYDHFHFFHLCWCIADPLNINHGLPLLFYAEVILLSFYLPSSQLFLLSSSSWRCFRGEMLSGLLNLTWMGLINILPKWVQKGEKKYSQHKRRSNNNFVSPFFQCLDWWTLHYYLSHVSKWQIENYLQKKWNRFQHRFDYSLAIMLLSFTFISRVFTKLLNGTILYMNCVH